MSATAAEPGLPGGGGRVADAAQQDVAPVDFDLDGSVRRVGQNVGGGAGGRGGPVVQPSLVDHGAEYGGQRAQQRGGRLVQARLVEKPQAAAEQLKPGRLVHATALGVVDPVLHDAERRDPAAPADRVGHGDRLDRGDRVAVDGDRDAGGEPDREHFRLGGRVPRTDRHQRGEVVHGGRAQRLQVGALVRAAAEVAVHRVARQAGQLGWVAKRAEVACHGGPVGKALKHPVRRPRLEHPQLRRQIGRVPRETTLVVPATDTPVREHRAAVRAQDPAQSGDEDLAGDTGGVPVPALVGGLIPDQVGAPPGHQRAQVDQARLEPVPVEQFGDPLGGQLTGLADVSDVTGHR
jgi:hypothetical protein